MNVFNLKIQIVIASISFYITGCGGLSSRDPRSTSTSIRCFNGSSYSKENKKCLPNSQTARRNKAPRGIEPNSAKNSQSNHSSLLKKNNSKVITQPTDANEEKVSSNVENPKNIDSCSQETNCKKGLSEQTPSTTFFPPSHSACLQKGLILNDKGTACREKTFIDFCEYQDHSYEVTKTIVKILNSLDMNDCESAYSYLKNHPTLDLSHGGQKISDITPIIFLKELKTLKLGNNRIHDIDALKKLKNLKELSLKNNQIFNIDSIRALPHIKYLDISGNNIEDPSPLYSVTNIKQVTVSPDLFLKIKEEKELQISKVKIGRSEHF